MDREDNHILIYVRIIIIIY